MSSNTVQTVEQQTVPFYGDELIAIRANDGNIYVSVRNVCEALGVSRATQARAIKNQSILFEGYVRGSVKTPPSSDGRGGGIQQATFMRVDLLPLWLAGINASRVSTEIRPKIEQYQRNAATTLWNAFRRGELTTESTTVENELSPAQQALALAKAVYEMAQAQVRIEQRLDSAEIRLELIESKLGSQISDAQAMEISQAVKTIALILGKRSGRNEYGGVYGELYRRFGVTSYKALADTQFAEALQFLNGWYQQLTDEGDIAF